MRVVYYMRVQESLLQGIMEDHTIWIWALRTVVLSGQGIGAAFVRSHNIRSSSIGSGYQLVACIDRYLDVVEMAVAFLTSYGGGSGRIHHVLLLLYIADFLPVVVEHLEISFLYCIRRCNLTIVEETLLVERIDTVRDSNNICQRERHVIL